MKDEIDELVVSRCKQLIVQQTGLQIAKRDQKKLCHSISERMEKLHLSNTSLYNQLISNHNKEAYNEIIHLACSLANKESYFFRDKGFFSVLKDNVLPDLIKQKQQQRKLKLWSAGCSSGEEPYSIGMLLVSLLPDWQNWDLNILGTDLCEENVKKAQTGIYGGMSFRAINDEDKNKFFSPSNHGWLVKPFIQKIVNFRQGNLIKDNFPNEASPLNHMDLIICRNVFIYFQQEAITKVVEKFSHTLNPNGYLLAGHGELHLQSHALSYMKSQLFPGALVYQKNG